MRQDNPKTMPIPHQDKPTQPKSRVTVPWTDEEDRDLIARKLRHEKTREIVAAYPHRSASSVNNRLHKLKLSGRLDAPVITRQARWTDREDADLIARHARKESGITMHAAYPHRSPAAIRGRLQKLGAAGRLVPHTTRAPWSDTERRTLASAYDRRAPWDELRALFPNRSRRSIKFVVWALTNRHRRRYVRVHGLRLRRRGVLRMPMGLISYDRRLRRNRDRCFLITPGYGRRSGVTLWLHRQLRLAERDNAQMYFRIVSRGVRGTQRMTNRVMLSERELTLLKSSLLADGFIREDSERFKIVQSAGRLGNGQSHAGYIWWWLWTMRRHPLTTGALHVDRGLRRECPLYGLRYSWKIRFNLYLNRFRTPRWWDQHYTVTHHGRERPRRATTRAGITNDYRRATYCAGIISNIPATPSPICICKTGVCTG